MKSLKVFSLLLILPVVNSIACESVDTVLLEYNVGYASQIDVAKAVECNLNKNLSKKSLCKTRVGLKEDLLDYAKRSFEYGMITRVELDEAKEELVLVRDICK